MDFYYSSNKNVQMLISILKANNIKKIVTSPGATHICFVASVQQDDFFEIYSAVDERGAAYMACGLATASGEPVVITCTGATASRNYLPAISEAHYRKLPIIAITGSQDISNAGNLSPQFIDRSEQPKDTYKLSVHLQKIKDESDEWDCNVKINRAILECVRNGGGPVHINLTNDDAEGLIVKSLPETRIIRRFTPKDTLPQISGYKKIAITVGAHKAWSDALTTTVEQFCKEHGAIVMVDHSSNYYGKYKILPTIVATQERYFGEMFDIDLLLHIGETSGDYYAYGRFMSAKEVWRISEDGEIRDTFKKLTNVFQMREEDFFKAYISNEDVERENIYYNECKKEIDDAYDNIPELEFSNIWIAKNSISKLPQNSVVQLGVSNTMRSWTFFQMPQGVKSIANIGCRGIDGTLSSVIGMSVANKDRLHYCILGDLTFFYNMNALGNRYVGNNLRIMLINNGTGTEFHMYSHPGKKQIDDAVTPFVSASGHFGAKSKELVKGYATALGFEYYSASTKEEFLEILPRFMDENIGDKSIVFEVFTEPEKENEALKAIRRLYKDPASGAKDAIKNILGESGTKFIRKIIK